jgi:hypothetical protein
MALSSLQSLGLRSNKIRGDGAAVFGHHLAALSSLQSLGIGDQRIGDDSSVSLFDGREQPKFKIHSRVTSGKRRKKHQLNHHSDTECVPDCVDRLVVLLALA